MALKALQSGASLTPVSLRLLAHARSNCSWRSDCDTKVSGWKSAFASPSSRRVNEDFNLRRRRCGTGKQVGRREGAEGVALAARTLQAMDQMGSTSCA